MEVLLTSLANNINTRVQSVKVYKHRWSNLSSRCNLLVNALREGEDGTTMTSAYVDVMNEVLSTLESIMRGVDRWANLSTMRSFLRQDEIRRNLEELESMVDTCLSQYHTRLNNEMTRAREEQLEAIRRDNLALREMLDELLASSTQYSADRTSLARNPALQLVMEDIQEEHRETGTVTSSIVSYDSQSFASQEDPLERGFQMFCKSLVTLELNRPIELIAPAGNPPKIQSSFHGQAHPHKSASHSIKSLVPSSLASSTSIRPPQLPPLQFGGDVVWPIGTITSAPSSPPSSRCSSALALPGSIPTGPSPATSIRSALHSPSSHMGRQRPSTLTPLETALTTRSSCYIWKSDTERRIISKATMEGLIDYVLLTSAADDPEQHNGFFIGHLSVISPRAVLQKIKRRFEEAVGSPPDIQDEIQHCVVRLINDWVQNENVGLGQLLLSDMKDFVSTITANDEVAPDGIVLQIVQGIHAKASMNLPPSPITSSFKPDIHQGPTPTDLAFALAKQEGEMYRRILPSEYVAHARNIEDGCPNLSAALLLIRRINFWVQSSILNMEFGTDKTGLEKRTETKRFFIIVAEECYNIGNFSSFHAILDALQSPAVAGLTLTHSQMSPRDQRRMTKLVKTSSTLYHGPKRDLQRCIPWHGAHLETIKALIKDLKDVHEHDNPPMLNCEKWIALSDAARSAVRFQDTLHMYENSPADCQRRETAVEYLRACLSRVDPDKDITQALLSKGECLEASEELLRTGRPAPLRVRLLRADSTMNRTRAQPGLHSMPSDPPSALKKPPINIIAPSSLPMPSTPGTHLAKDARLILPQVALDHAIAHESSVRKALEAACDATDATYMIQVGFNEDMLQSNQGTLQEIYVYLNFDIQPNSKLQVLDRLSRILSPFPCTVHTPSDTLPLSIVGQDGNELTSKEMWAVFRSRGIFTPDSNLQADNHSSAVCLKESFSTRVTQGNDKTSRGVGGNFSGAGGASTSGHTGGVGRKPNYDQSPPMPGNNCYSDSGSGSDPEPSSTMPQRLPVTLDVPLKTGLKIAWSQEPEVFQEFNTTSRLFVIVQDAATAYNPFDDTEVNSGFGPYPGPTVDARFIHLHVATANQAESQSHYEMHLARARISATSCSDTLSWFPRTTPGGSDTIRKVETTNKSLGGSFNLAQWTSVGFFQMRSSTSGTERNENLSGVVVESSFTDDDTSFVRWTYDISDAKERKLGRDFQQPPRVKFGFSKPNERPQIGVRLIVTWSLAIPPKNIWSLSLKKKTRPPPIFRTFLQDVSAFLQLDGLTEPSRIGDPRLSATSRSPSAPSIPPHPPISQAAPGQHSMDTNMEPQARATAKRQALNYVGAEIPDVTAVFKSALYGCVRDRDAPRDIH